MNYENKLRLAKEALESGSYDEKTIKYIFPELAESEDEKIKRILHSISSKMSFYLRNIFTEEEFQCFDAWSNAWLEKQGKENPLKGTLGDVFDDLKLGIDPSPKQGEQKPLETTKSEEFLKELSLSLQIQAYLNTASDELYAKGKPLYSEKRIEDIHRCMQMWAKLHNAYFLSSPEQKPVEWSEEDYTKLKIAITLLEHPAVISNNGEILEKTVDWLNSLKERCLPQPKQEWSEDDIKEFKAELQSLMFEWSNKKDNMGVCIDRHIDKLLSILCNHTQSQWKPSDEQMKALKEACDKHWEPDGLDPLYILWEQLKKLREE